MGAVLSALLAGFATLFRSHLALQLGILALRHQLAIYQRSVKRPRIRPADRMFWSWLSSRWAGSRQALVFVQPATVISWQRKRFRDHWARMSRAGKPGRPPISKEIRELIRKVSGANLLWGTPRIIGELGKLGIDVAKSTVDQYRVRPRRPSSPARCRLPPPQRSGPACDANAAHARSRARSARAFHSADQRQMPHRAGRHWRPPFRRIGRKVILRRDRQWRDRRILVLSAEQRRREHLKIAERRCKYEIALTPVDLPAKIVASRDTCGPQILDRRCSDRLSASGSAPARRGTTKRRRA